MNIIPGLLIRTLTTTAVGITVMYNNDGSMIILDPIMKPIIPIEDFMGPRDGAVVPVYCAWPSSGDASGKLGFVIMACGIIVVVKVRSRRRSEAVL